MTVLLLLRVFFLNSVHFNPTEQANLQQLFDLYFIVSGLTVYYYLTWPHSRAASHGLIPMLPCQPHSHATSGNEADLTLVASICSVHTSCFLFQTEDIEYMCTSCRGKLARLSHQLARLPR